MENKSCFICKNMPFCKHFDNLFNKINYAQFASNSSKVIDTISESIGKNCTCYAEFENKKTCKWEMTKSNRFKTDCGCVAPINYINPKECNGRICPGCDKKIEVVG